LRVLFFFFILFVVLFTAAWDTDTGRIHKNGNRSGRKAAALLGGGNTSKIQTEGAKKSGSAIALALVGSLGRVRPFP
jgi:hypothetical protein